MKRKILVVVDMQNDFITGSLGTKEAEAICPAVIEKINGYQKDASALVYATLDTHLDNYLDTPEGQKLPVPHCIRGTEGHRIEPSVLDALEKCDCTYIKKPTFGSLALAHIIRAVAETDGIESIELCGLCTDICVVSNGLLLKAALPEVPILVDAACCAGVTPASHEAALTTMSMCQIEILNPA